MSSLLSRRRLFQVAVTLGIALALGGISAVQVVVSSMREINAWSPTHALIMQTPFWVFWALTLPLIIFLVRRIPIDRTNFKRTIPLHVLIGVAIAIGVFSVLLWFMGLIGHANWSLQNHSFWVHFGPELRNQLPAHIVTYLLILSGVLIWSYYRLFRERELVASQLAAQLSQARLQALRMQLNPHFLFNAMNSISMLVRRNDNAQAVRMIAGLSDLLRHVLEDSTGDEVPLADEIAFLKRYLEIERVRFQDRLTVRFDVSDETLGAFVPNLLLQPLVENAIRHGIARKVNPGTVEIAARRLGDRLILQVSDDGPGLTGPSADGTGVGVRNTEARLDQLYGGASSFELRSGTHGGAVATVTLPFHAQPLQHAGSSAA